jgi:hypothetical protein
VGRQRRRHVERNIADKAVGTYHGTFLTIDEPKWRDEWDAPHHRVRDYFQGRADFLEIDITRGAHGNRSAACSACRAGSSVPLGEPGPGVHGSTGG